MIGQGDHCPLPMRWSRSETLRNEQKRSVSHQYVPNGFGCFFFFSSSIAAISSTYHRNIVTVMPRSPWLSVGLRRK